MVVRLTICCLDHFRLPPVIDPPVRTDLPTPRSETASADPNTSFDGSHQSQNILGIPVEMLAEICAYLEPLDVRAMSLTNKSFRNILMSRESHWIWESARTGTYDGIPKCPKDLSEPQYVRLLFVSECFTCNKPATKMDLLNRVKSCTACFKANHISRTQAVKGYKGFPKHLMFPPRNALASDKALYRPRIRADFARYKAILKSTAAERAAYEATVAEQAIQPLESSVIIREWMYRESAKQENARRDLRRSRIKSIANKMLELGHHRDDIELSSNDIKLLHDVTEDEWNVMRPVLEARAIKNRDARR